MSQEDRLSEWAENFESFGPEARLANDEETRAQTRADLEAALGGREALERLVRGRPSLKGADHVRGDRSPTITVRVTPQLDAALAALVLSQNRRRSDVVRDALEEYAERHSA